MPEGPEVETIVRGIRTLEGKKIMCTKLIEDTVFQTPFHDLNNKHIEKIERVSKHIIIKFEDSAMLVHLSLSGQLYAVEKDTPLEKHCKFTIDFEDGQQLRYIDQRKYGKIWHTTYEECKRRTKHIAPEIYEMSYDQYYDRISQKKYIYKTIKGVLLDQKFVAGVGNIYASEILFHCKTLPSIQICNLTETQFRDLFFYIDKVLKDATERNGTTFDAYRTGTGGYGDNQNHLMVYGQKVCKVCGGPITNNKHLKPKDRTSYFCTTCQH